MELAQSKKPYHSNHFIVYSCQYHVIFCPKYRRSVLRPPLDARLKELILEKQESYGYTVLGMEVMPEHVHLLLDVNPQIGIAKIVGQIKGYTAHMLRQEFPWLKKRLPSLCHAEPAEHLSVCRHVRRQDSEGCQARRPARRAAHKVRTGREPQDGAGPRAHHTPIAPPLG
jgi:REP-associated tyrosine transposase